MDAEAELHTLFGAVSEKWLPSIEGGYFGGLDVRETALVLLTMLDTEVCNGGFLHWTTCQIGEYSAETRDAVVCVGDLKVTSLIDSAMARNASDKPSMNELAGNQSMYDIDSEYYAVRDEFILRCLRWWTASN